MSNAKEDYKTHLLTSFSRNPKILYRDLQHLSKFSETPQCLVYDSSFVSDPIDKVEVFNRFLNSTFTVSDFALPSIDQMPTSVNQLSHITLDKSDVF